MCVYVDIYTSCTIIGDCITLLTFEERILNLIIYFDCGISIGVVIEEQGNTEIRCVYQT